MNIISPVSFVGSTFRKCPLKHHEDIPLEHFTLRVVTSITQLWWHHNLRDELGESSTRGDSTEPCQCVVTDTYNNHSHSSTAIKLRISPTFTIRYTLTYTTTDQKELNVFCIVHDSLQYKRIKELLVNKPPLESFWRDKIRMHFLVLLGWEWQSECRRRECSGGEGSQASREIAIKHVV